MKRLVLFAIFGSILMISGAFVGVVTARENIHITEKSGGVITLGDGIEDFSLLERLCFSIVAFILVMVAYIIFLHLIIKYQLGEIDIGTLESEIERISNGVNNRLWSIYESERDDDNNVPNIITYLQILHP